MTVKIFSAVIHRGQVLPVTVEMSKSRGSLPGWRFVGSVHKSVREGKERVWSTLKHLRLRFPQGRYTVNIQPAKIPKHGSSLDLAIALGVLQLHQYIPIRPYTAIGELSLDGKILPPEGNFALIEALLDSPVYGSNELGDLKYHPQVGNLRPVSDIHSCLQLMTRESFTPLTPVALPSPLHMDIPRQISRSLVRILALALAGGHSTLLYGSPGVGKTFAKKGIEALLPSESWERWRKRRRQTDLFPAQTAERIFSPAHTISRSAFLSRLQQHPEVLFLDEFPEFRSECREALRQWLEVTSVVEGVNQPEVTIATANPCRCGYFGTLKCSCRSDERAQYQKKLSGPLLDRFAIQWRVSDRDLVTMSHQDWQWWQEKIQRARKLQQARVNFPARASFYTWSHVQQLQPVQPESELNLRRSLFVHQVAQTLADLEATEPSSQHIFEARQLVNTSFTAET